MASPPPGPVKSWTQSRTLILNGIVLFLAAAATTVGVLQTQPTFTYAGLLTAILAGLNMALRVTTYQGLTIGLNQGPITIDAGGTQFTGPTRVDGALVGGNVGTVDEPPAAPAGPEPPT